jgi:hypothetical protein
MHEFVTKRLKLQLAMIKTLHVSQGIDPAKYSAPKTKWHPAMELAGAKEIPLNERAKDFDKFSLSTGSLQFLVHERVAAEQQACELAGTTARPQAPPVPATTLVLYIKTARFSGPARPGSQATCGPCGAAWCLFAKTRELPLIRYFDIYLLPGVQSSCKQPHLFAPRFCRLQIIRVRYTHLLAGLGA